MLAIPEEPLETPIKPQRTQITSERESELRQYLTAQAVLNNLNPDMVLYIVEKESGFNERAIGDMHLTCQKTGEPIRSLGIFQINTCVHEIADETAFNYKEATAWAIPHLQTEPHIWTAYGMWLREHGLTKR